MKIPSAKKLPSGNWYSRVRVHGQDISITRPTKKEAVAEAMAIKSGIRTERSQEPLLRRSRTLSQAIDLYISSREYVLSPSTIAGYRAIQRTRFSGAMPLRLCDLTQDKWQQIVNAEARLVSAKTLRNAWGLVSSVILDCTGQRISVRLPQVVDKDRPYLTAEQVPIFVNAIQGASCEIPALLALSSLRRSEILALHWEDIDLSGGTIRISGAAVIGQDHRLVHKATNKNRTSQRVIPIIPPLRAALDRHGLANGLVVQMAPSTLYKQINAVCRAANLPTVGVHGLRRSFASLAYHLGLSEEVTMRIGGWSDIYTMRKIYTKVSQKDIADQAAVFKDFFQPSETDSGDGNDDS